MNEKLKKIRDELAKDYSDLNRYNEDDNSEAFTEGFDAAIPHVREEILDLMDEVCFCGSRELIEKELKKMDEAGE